ncbi:hypothetical protein AtEden1_Chr4g0288471 [Arabidopsis thaliana]
MDSFFPYMCCYKSRSNVDTLPITPRAISSRLWILLHLQPWIREVFGSLGGCVLLCFNIYIYTEETKDFIRLEIVVAKSRFAKTRSMICYGDDSMINAWSDPWKQLERNKNLIVLAEEDVKEKEATKSSKKQRNKPYVLEMTAKELDKVSRHMQSTYECSRKLTTSALIMVMQHCWTKGYTKVIF